MESATVRAESTPNRGWHLVRIVLAGLLLTASALKCWQLAAEPIIGISLLESRWLLMATVEFEVFLGIWLLANYLPRLAWAMALICFIVFTCVSLYKALSGYVSCGCFGSVPVNPWYTSVLDLTVVFSLLYWRPKPTLDDKANRHRSLKGEPLIITTIGLLLEVCAYIWVSHATDVRLMELGQVLEAGSVVKLQPAMWLGSKFPLLGYTTIDGNIAQGEWYIMLYSEGCDQCRTAMQEIVEMAKRNYTPLAVIRVHGRTEEKVDENGILIGSLTTDISWVVETPVLLRLRDNQVESVMLRSDFGLMTKADSLGWDVRHYTSLLMAM